MSSTTVTPSKRSSTRGRRHSERLNTPTTRGQAKQPAQRSDKKAAAAAIRPLLPLESTTSTSEDSDDLDDGEVNRLQNLQSLLDKMTGLATKYRARRHIGQGTFSTVYKAELKDNVETTADQVLEKKIAIKHLIPTSSPDRVFIEVESLRLCNGEKNVVPLLFCHRLRGDIILAMRYVKPTKFSEVVPKMTYYQMVEYMRNLLIALEHVHSVGIIHRDVKPANFLFDFRRKIFRLVDFGLAQFTQLTTQAQWDQSVAKATAAPECMKKLTKADLGDSNQETSSSSPVKKKPKLEITEETNNQVKNTPPKNCTTVGPDGDKGAPGAYYDHYDRRGSLRRSTPTKQSISQSIREEQAERMMREHRLQQQMQAKTTPKKRKSLLQLQGDIQVRRSPRKHYLKHEAQANGFSKLTISGSAIVNNSSTPPINHINSNSSLKRTPSFTILDPTSGIPSAEDATLRLRASLTSRSFNNSHMAVMATYLSQQQQINMQSQSQLMYQQQQKKNQKTALNRRYSQPNMSSSLQCACYGMAHICDRCTGSTRRSLKAARAGTPGFRPPEVLLKCEHQTTAVDVWAAGVVMLCIVSRTYPFFRASDDLVHLGEIVCLFGSEAVVQAASQYGRKLVMSEHKEARDWRGDLTALACRDGAHRDSESHVTSDSLDRLEKLLKLLASERITATDALKHKIFHRKN